MRNVQIKVTRTDTWWPVIEVPELMTDEEAEEWINAEAPDEVFDLYRHKDTLNTTTDAEVQDLQRF
tara:strand:- start:157 stop:354 length:198 start_codon:yes stop_codon:yes gene_type:complete